MNASSAANIVIRPAGTNDIEQMIALNEAAVPDVNSIPHHQMQRFAEQAFHCRVAAQETLVVGLLVALLPGASYDSVNFKWFEERYQHFVYVDRIIVGAAARGNGLARRFYDDLREHAPADSTIMACEVNSRPPNDASMRFHTRYGFTEVGRQQTEQGLKEVVLMTRPLAG